MKRQRPPEGWPHEQPGHKFYTDALRAWLGGYSPQLAEQMSRSRSITTDSRNSTAARERSMALGCSYAMGTIHGLSLKSAEKLAQMGKIGRLKKSSGLG